MGERKRKLKIAIPPRAARATRATRPGEAPLQATATPAAPGIFPMTWKDGFAVGHGTCSNFIRGLQRMHSKTRKQWGIQLVDWAEDGQTVLRMKEQRWFKTRSDADAAMLQWAVALRAEAKQRIAADARKPLADEQDLAAARLKVLGEQYPDTFKAFERLATAAPGARHEAMYAVFRAYAADMVRLHKPATIEGLTPFTTPADISFILEIAKAYKAQSPYDAVDVELAARWLAAGYNKMSLAEYTRAINTKTGANLNPDAMKKRRLKKLGLASARPEGRPEKPMPPD